MANVFEYLFNIGGNFTNQINGMTDAAGRFSGEVEAAKDKTSQWASALASFDYFSNITKNMASGVSELSAAGVKLDAQMHDLSAVAGVTGGGLKQIEQFARESAKTFGTDASVAVEGYKLLLSQLSPELGKYPDALREMGDCIQTTSKLMGGDGVAAAQVLTTAMNQYGVSLEDPMAASEEMARMMNVMAAAGQAGSAELPAISAALQQCGMAAKAANVSFEETNAAIQVLDKAGKKASEGGVALRNVLGQLSKGRFVEKAAREELEKAGIDVIALGDNSKTLKERLEMLKPMLNDSALLSKFFGVENANAARALIQGTDALQDFTDAVSGTNSAEEQASIIMDSYAERQARINQKVEDFKISIFQATGDLTLWCGTILSTLVPISQLTPLIYAAANAVKFLKNQDFKGAFTGVVSEIRKIMVNLGLMDTAVLTSGGIFTAFKVLCQNACRAIGVAIMNIPIVGWIAAAIAVVIAIIQQLWDKCYSFRVAIFTAWEGIKAIFSGAWELISNVANKIAEFASEIWQKIKSMAEMVANIFMSVVNKIRSWIAAVRDFVAKVVNAVIAKVSSMCKPLVTAFKNVASAIKGFFAKIIDWIRDKFYSLINWVIDKYNWIAEKLNLEKIAQLGREAADRSWAKDHPESVKDNSKDKGRSSNTDASETDVPDVSIPGLSIPSISGKSGGSRSSGDSGGSGSDGGRIKNITIKIDKLVERFEIHTASVGESAEQVKALILESLMGALNDTQLATE